MAARKYDEQVRQNVGLNLITSKRGSQRVTATFLSLSPRTLRTWKRRAKLSEPCRKLGRPSKVIKQAELFAIAREWKRQGYPGAEAVHNGLPGSRRRLVRKVIAQLKTKRQSRARRHQLKNRTTVAVKKTGVLLVMDAAKKPDKDGGEIIVTRDRGSLKTEARVSSNGATCALDTLCILNKLKSENRLPLVLGSDNGSPFVAGEVVAFLDENKVIQLKSLPRVPQQMGLRKTQLEKLSGLSNPDSAALNLAQY